MNNEEIALVEKLTREVDKTIEKIWKPDNLESYLQVVWHCFGQGFKNTTLIWRQSPNATDVAGIKKWAKDGRKPKDDAKPILILLPYIRYIEGSGVPKRTEDGDIATDQGRAIIYDKEPEYEYGYLPRTVFDISSMTGNRPGEEIKDISWIEDKVRKSGCSISPEEPKDIPQEAPDGFVEHTKYAYVIHISKGIDPSSMRYTQILLKHFSDIMVSSCYQNDTEGGAWNGLENNIDIVNIIVRYCVQKALTGQTTVSNLKMLCAAANNFSHEEKHEILRFSVKCVTTAIYCLKGNEMNFTDTAMANGIVDSASSIDFAETMMKVQRATDGNIEWTDNAFSLLEKSAIDETLIKRLYNQKLDNKVIFSSPPIRVYSPGEERPGKEDGHE